MQLPIVGLIAYLHAQFRKAQLKFSPGLSPTLIFSFEIDISKNIRWLKTQICYLLQQEGKVFLSKLKVWFKNLKNEREKTRIQRNMLSLHIIKNRLPFALKGVVMWLVTQLARLSELLHGEEKIFNYLVFLYLYLPL